MSCGKEQIVTYDTNSDLVHRISYRKEQIATLLRLLVHRISCGKENRYL